VNRCAPHLHAACDGWRAGLPPFGVLGDVRPLEDPDVAWPHLMPIGFVLGPKPLKVAVRVPAGRDLKALGVHTLVMPMDPRRVQWRPIVVPDSSEVIHA
jgi:hypothetical protein